MTSYKHSMDLPGDYRLYFTPVKKTPQGTFYAYRLTHGSHGKLITSGEDVFFNLQSMPKTEGRIAANIMWALTRAACTGNIPDGISDNYRDYLKSKVAREHCKLAEEAVRNGKGETVTRASNPATGPFADIENAAFSAADGAGLGKLRKLTTEHPKAAEAVLEYAERMGKSRVANFAQAAAALRAVGVRASNPNPSSGPFAQLENTILKWVEIRREQDGIEQRMSSIRVEEARRTKDDEYANVQDLADRYVEAEADLEDTYRKVRECKQTVDEMMDIRNYKLIAPKVQAHFEQKHASAKTAKDKRYWGLARDILGSYVVGRSENPYLPPLNDYDLGLNRPSAGYQGRKHAGAVAMLENIASGDVRGTGDGRENNPRRAPVAFTMYGEQWYRVAPLRWECARYPDVYITLNKADFNEATQAELHYADRTKHTIAGVDALRILVRELEDLRLDAVSAGDPKAKKLLGRVNEVHPVSPEYRAATRKLDIKVYGNSPEPEESDGRASNPLSREGIFEKIEQLAIRLGAKQDAAEQRELASAVVEHRIVAEEVWEHLYKRIQEARDEGEEAVAKRHIAACNVLLDAGLGDGGREVNPYPYPKSALTSKATRHRDYRELESDKVTLEEGTPHNPKDRRGRLALTQYGKRNFAVQVFHEAVKAGTCYGTPIPVDDGKISADDVVHTALWKGRSEKEGRREYAGIKRQFT